MPDKYIIQRRTASGLETVVEVPALENGKIDMSWLPVVGAMGSAIIERGSNANGEYIRWADGTQICIKNIVYNNIVITVEWGTLYQSDTFSPGAWPAVFTERPLRVLGVSNSLGYLMWCVPQNEQTMSNCGTVRLVRGMSAREESEVIIHILGIGRWK